MIATYSLKYLYCADPMKILSSVIETIETYVSITLLSKIVSITLHFTLEVTIGEIYKDEVVDPTQILSSQYDLVPKSRIIHP